MAVVAPDIAAYASEPTLQPGALQPHGVLLVCDQALNILQASENCGQFLAREAAGLLGRPLSAVLGPSNTAQLRATLAREADASIPRPQFIGRLPLAGGQRADAMVHRRGDRVLLEMEAADGPGTPDFAEMYRVARTFLSAIQGTSSVARLCELAVREIRRVTGFDRVLACAFDEDGHGQVLAEDVAGPGVRRYAGLRFPAGDIPPQARELYRLNPVQLIPDAGYRACALLPGLDPETQAPADLRFAALRGIPPAQRLYLRDMDTAASMSVSLVVGGRLWGLICCHHRQPRHVPFERRAVCEHLGQILALQIEASEDHAETAHRLHLRQQLVRMLAVMADEGGGVVQGLLAHPESVLGFMRASGAAIVEGGTCHCIGQAPAPGEVLRLSDWLGRRGRALFRSTQLAQDYPGASALGAEFGGALAVAISELHEHWVIWFRPEVTRVLRWAGRPDSGAGARVATADPVGALPQNGVAEWREVVRGRSEPWRASEVDIANEFRSAIVALVMRRAEETAELAAALQRSNHELEAFSYSVSHDLRAPLRHIVGYSELLRDLKGDRLDPDSLRYVANIADAAVFAGKLVDNLLSFSQMGRAALKPATIALDGMVQALVAEVDAEYRAAGVQWQIDTLPEVFADPTFLQLALRNLLANAAKYSRDRKPPRVHVWGEQRDDETHMHVRDNGVGFNMKYIDKLFGIFQRLHRVEEFEGTGIGLANVKRIVERHGGRVWAQAQVGAGATFSFALPRPSATAS